MGMFDWYEPEPALNCPVCGKPLDHWQGKDGPCGLFVWRQGVPSPVEQRVDDECRLPADELKTVRLPQEFIIYTDCCGGRLWVEAIGRCKQDTWADTEPVTGDRVKQRPEERRGTFKARMKWFRGEATDGE